MLPVKTTADAGDAEPRDLPTADLDRRVLVASRHLIRAVALYSRRLVARHRITGPQLLCLNQLAETSDGLTVGQLAGAVHLSPSTVVRILDRLEARGLVRRERATGDRRRVIVTATAAGRQFSLLTPYSAEHPLRQALQQLDDRDRETLATLLETLIESMASPSLTDVPAPPLDTLIADQRPQD